MEFGQAEFTAWVARRVEAEKKKGIKPAWPAQAQAIKQAEAINVHADPDTFPDRLFKERAPNQTPEQFKYQKANYRCTTNPVFQDYLSAIGRAWIDGNWQIIWPDGSEDMQKYVDEQLPVFGSLEIFMRHVCPPIKSIDANGVLAVRPAGFKVITREDGTVVIDDREPFTPTVYYHRSESILHLTNDLVVAVDAEKSEVLVGDKEVKEGRIIYAYTPERIMRARQYGKREDNTYVIDLVYEHGEGVMPCRQLAGVPMIGPDGVIYWISPFYYAVANLDFALVGRNWLQSMMSNCAFPFRIVQVTPCDFKDDTGKCQGGLWLSLAGGKVEGTCKACGGRGHRVPISPLGEYQYQVSTDLDGKSTSPTRSPVEYVEPGDTSMKFVADQVATDTEKAKSILHLHSSNSEVKGSSDMTATGMAIDQTAQFAFVRSISDQLFDIYDWLLKRISWQRYSNYEQVPTLIYPQHFDFRTEADIWVNIERARNAGAPPYVIQSLYMALLNNQLVSNPEAQSVFETVVGADRLFTLSGAEITARKAQNLIEPWQITLHDGSLQLAMQLARDVEGFNSLPVADRVAQLVELAKSVTFVPKAATSLDLLKERLNGV